MTNPPDETRRYEPVEPTAVTPPTRPSEDPTTARPPESPPIEGAGNDDTRPMDPVLPPTEEPTEPPTATPPVSPPVPGPTLGEGGPPPEPPGDDGEPPAGGGDSRPWIIGAIIAVIAAGVLVAVLADDEDPISGGTTTTTLAVTTTSTGEGSTSTEPAETTTTVAQTTTVAETTTTVAETTTTVAETTTTTTTEPPPEDTQVVAADSCVLGYWDAGWQDPDPNEPLPVTAGETYQVVVVDVVAGTSTGGPPELVEENLVYWRIAFDPPLPGPFQGVAVQTAGDVVPHAVADDQDEAPWVETTRQLLVERGISAPDVEIPEVVEADLEGDGTVETIVVAFNNEEPNGELIPAVPGSYGLVYLVKEIDGEPQVAVLAESVIPDDGDDSLVLVEHALAAVADLNDDGRMEMLVSGVYFEGGAIEAFEYVNDDLGPVSVLGCGVGA